MTFSLLSGEFVHEARTPNERLLAAMTASARSLASVSPETPLEISRAVDRALAYERTDRWPTARAMREALRTAHASAHLAGSTARETLPPPPRPSISDGDAGGSVVPARTSAVERSPPVGFAKAGSRFVPAGLAFAALSALAVCVAFAGRSSPEPKALADIAPSSADLTPPAPPTVPSPAATLVELPETNVGGAGAAATAFPISSSPHPPVHHRAGAARPSTATAADATHRSKASPQSSSSEGLLDRRH